MKNETDETDTDFDWTMKEPCTTTHVKRVGSRGATVGGSGCECIGEHEVEMVDFEQTDTLVMLAMLMIPPARRPSDMVLPGVVLRTYATAEEAMFAAEAWIEHGVITEPCAKAREVERC